MPKCETKPWYPPDSSISQTREEFLAKFEKLASMEEVEGMDGSELEEFLQGDLDKSTVHE